MQEEDILKVKALVIEPNDCPLSAPLHVSLKYTLLKPVPAGSWDLVYEADYTNKRQCIALHRSDPVDLVAGDHEFSHTVPTIKTEGVKEKYLLQVGVLKLTLHGQAGAENVAVINMVTQVTKKEDGLHRSIMNPMDE